MKEFRLELWEKCLPHVPTAVSRSQIRKPLDWYLFKRSFDNLDAASGEFVWKFNEFILDSTYWKHIQLTYIRCFPSQHAALVKTWSHSSAVNDACGTCVALLVCSRPQSRRPSLVTTKPKRPSDTAEEEFQGTLQCLRGWWWNLFPVALFLWGGVAWGYP